MSLFEMPWLPRSGNLKTSMELVKNGTASTGQDLQHLCSHYLNTRDLLRLARQVKKLNLDECNIKPLSTVKIRLLSNVTTDFFEDAIIGSGPRFGVLPLLSKAPFNQVV